MANREVAEKYDELVERLRVAQSDCKLEYMGAELQNLEGMAKIYKHFAAIYQILGVLAMYCHPERRDN